MGKIKECFLETTDEPFQRLPEMTFIVANPNFDIEFSGLCVSSWNKTENTI